MFKRVGAKLLRRASTLIAFLSVANAGRAAGIDPSVRADEYSKGAVSLSDQALEEIQSGELDSAVASLKEAVRRDPSDPALHYNLGKLYLKRREVDLAIKSLTQTIRLDPDEVAAYDMRGLAYTQKKRLYPSNSGF